MKKKIVALCMMLVLAFSMTGCGLVRGIVKETMDNMSSKNELGDDNYEIDIPGDMDELNNLGDTLDNLEDIQQETENLLDRLDELENTEGTTVPEEPQSEGEISFTLPENFVWSEEDQTWYTTEYPNILANVNYMYVENDGSFSQVTKEIMEPALEDTLTSTYGTTIDLDITAWDAKTIAGYEAIDYIIEYTWSGMNILQRQVIINGTDNFHYITLTELKEEGYNNSFNNVIDTIKFE